jgi:DNA-binding response OmpR family regulator
MQRLVLVEDNADLRESLETYLKSEGFRVFAYESAESATDIVHEGSFDLALIDINLPGKSGFELVNDIRGLGHTMPLIALTARDAVHDKVRGFENGLTDYVVKPFSLAELTARIRAHVRSSRIDGDIVTASLTLRPDRREVLLKGKPIQMTATEFRLLAALARNNGRIVTTEDLIAEGWGEADRYNDPPLRIHIRNIRAKLDDAQNGLIRNVPGSGYLLEDML